MDDEHDCENCKHCDQNIDTEPCLSCWKEHDKPCYWRWEAKTDTNLIEENKDNSLDALIDEALDEMEAKIKTGNFIGHCPTPRKENDNGKTEL